MFIKIFHPILIFFFLKNKFIIAEFFPKCKYFSKLFTEINNKFFLENIYTTFLIYFFL